MPLIIETKMTESSMVAMRAQIAHTYEVIRPYIRRTPVVEVDAADFGLDAMPLVLKLESMQHTGSFKTRGDRKSTRLNSSHLGISYAVFCLKKNKQIADGRAG